jgi:DNA replication protein DnaC
MRPADIEDVRRHEKLAVKHALNTGKPESLSHRTGLPPRAFDKTWDDLQVTSENRELMNRAGELLEGFREHWRKGVGLTLLGPTGVGKTTVSMTVAVDLATDGFMVRYTTMANMLARMRNQIALESIRDDEIAANEWCDNHSFLNEVTFAAHLLVIDDVGKEKRSEWTDAVLDQIVRTRYDLGLPSILTSNLTVDAWGEQFGRASQDFLYEMSTVVILNGGSWRER